MNFSKLIWVGSCVGGLLSCPSSVEVLTKNNNSNISPFPDAVTQDSTDADSSLESGESVPSAELSGFQQPDANQEAIASFFASLSSTSHRRVTVDGLHVHSSLLLKQAAADNPEASAEQDSPVSFFAALTRNKEAPLEEVSNQRSTASNASLPLVSVKTIDETIAPVVTLSRHVIEQMTPYGTVAVLPRQAEASTLPTQSDFAAQDMSRSVSLPSLQAGMIDQCAHLLQQPLSDQPEAISGDAPNAQASVSRSIPIRFSANEREYRVFVNNRLVAEFPNQRQARQFATTTKTLLNSESFDPEAIKPRIIEGQVAIATVETSLLVVDDDLTAYTQTLPVALAIAWSNTLREALGVAPLTLADAQTSLQSLQPTGDHLRGTASWYGPYFHGRLTASGELFDQSAMTAAHPSLPFDTYLKVTNLENGQSIVVRINDRGPYVGERSLDLSRQAAECLGSEITGVVPYEAKILKPSDSSSAEPPSMTLISKS